VRFTTHFSLFLLLNRKIRFWKLIFRGNHKILQTLREKEKEYRESLDKKSKQILTDLEECRQEFLAERQGELVKFIFELLKVELK
jgi:hypothetical protein